MGNILYMVNDWCNSMSETLELNTNENIIDMEGFN